MEGFDDLLKSSANGFEEDPFGNPFAQTHRSASPDPWANPYVQQDQDAATTVFTDSTPLEYPETVEEVTKTDPEPVSSAGPLDLSALEEEEEPATGTTTSGFREFRVQPFQPSAEAAAVSDELKAHASEATLATTVGISGEATTTPPHAFNPPINPASMTTPAPVDTEPAKVPSDTSPSEPSTEIPVSHEPASTLHDPNSWSTTHESFSTPLDRPAPPFSSAFLNNDVQGDENGWGDNLDAGTTTIREPSISSTSGWHSKQPTDEDDDDDKPLQAIVDRSRADAESKHGNSVGSTSPKDDKDGVFNITVDDPQKVGDPIRGYTMYTVHTRTTSALFRTPSFSVLRRYSDFLWLYETLSLNNPGVVVPPVPEKSPFGRFDENFVEQRRQALEKCINKMANHPVLMKDGDLKMFLESDTFALDIKQRKAEIANERGGIMASLGQTIAGPRFHETDEWFDHKKSYLDSLETQLRGLVKAIDTVAKQRSELAIAIGEFSQTILDLAASDVGNSLSQALSGLADVERRAQNIQSKQSREDIMTIMSTTDEYARLISSVRLAFTSRIRTYHAWQSADAEVRRVKQLHERNRAQGRIQADRVGYSMSQIADAERRSMDTKQEYEQCSRLIKSEVARFEQERITDFKASLQRFLDGMIDGQKQMIAGWESYQQTLLKAANTRQAHIVAGEGVEANGHQ